MARGLPILDNNIIREIDEFDIQDFIDTNEVSEYTGELKGLKTLEEFLNSIISTFKKLADFIMAFINKVLGFLKEFIGSIVDFVKTILGYITELLGGLGLPIEIRSLILSALARVCKKDGMSNGLNSITNLIMTSLLLTISCDIDRPFSITYRHFLDNKFKAIDIDISDIQNRIDNRYKQNTSLVSNNLRNKKTQYRVALKSSTDTTIQDKLTELDTLQTELSTLQSTYESYLAGKISVDIDSLNKEIIEKKTAIQTKQSEIDLQAKTIPALSTLLDEISTLEIELNAINSIEDTEIITLKSQLKSLQDKKSIEKQEIDKQFTIIAAGMLRAIDKVDTRDPLTVVEDITSTTPGLTVITRYNDLAIPVINAITKDMKIKYSNIDNIPTGSRFNFDITTVSSKYIDISQYTQYILPLEKAKALLRLLALIDRDFLTIAEGTEFTLAGILDYPLIDDIVSKEFCSNKLIMKLREPTIKILLYNYILSTADMKIETNVSNRLTDIQMAIL